MGPPNQPFHPDALPFGRLWCSEPNAISNAIDYAKHRSGSHGAAIRVYDAAGYRYANKPAFANVQPFSGSSFYGARNRLQDAV
jgi:hypothetical protein